MFNFKIIEKVKPELECRQVVSPSLTREKRIIGRGLNVFRTVKG